MDADPRWLEAVSTVDGLGRPLVTKARAVVEGELGWVGSGRVVTNNKGNPVKQYEPYTSETDAYEGEGPFVGVSPELRYDALGRLTSVLFPDGTTSRVEFSPWGEAHFDQPAK